MRALSRVAADSAVPRPSVSPLFWAGVACWAGGWVGTEAALRAWCTGTRSAVEVAWAVVATATACGVFARRSRLRLPAAAFALGLCVALLHGAWVTASATRAASAGPAEWRAVVAADPVAGPTGATVALRLRDGPAAGAVAVVGWPAGEPLPEYGRLVRVRARLRVVDGSKPSGRAEFRSGRLLRGTPWRVAEDGWTPGPLGRVACWRAAALGRLRGLRGDGPALVASMLFGDRTRTSGSPVEEDAKAAGVAWLLNASGLHLAALLLLADRIAAFVGLGRRGRAGASIGVGAVVCAAAGARIALVRAALVAAAAVLARLAGRRRDVTAAVGVAVLVLVCLDPAAAEDVGLLLGVVAVTAIALFGRLAAEWLRPIAGRALATAMAASVVAQVAVAPISASLFGALNALAPASLVVSAPLAATAVGLGASGAVAGGRLGAPLTALACMFAQGAATVWHVAAGLPGAVVPVASVPWWAWAAWVTVPALAWWRWPSPRRGPRLRAIVAVVVTLVAILALIPRPAGPEIVVMDVGQGDSILVRDSGHAMLVDTGPDPVTLRRALSRNGVRAVDGVVLTHIHADHVGGISGLRGVVAEPAWIGVPDVDDRGVDRLAAACAGRAGTVIRLRRGMTWRVGETTVRVLWPQGGERQLQANDTSVVLLLARHGAAVALLLGDAEQRAQLGALDAFSGRVPIMKAAHHGSVNGVVPEALSAWCPRVVLISCGAGNPFGHPHRAALEAYGRIGAQIHRTDLEGDLVWAVDATGVCDNRTVRTGAAGAPVGRAAWPRAISAISSPSTSSTAPRSSCWRTRSVGCGTVWPRWRTSISTWRPSTASRPPPTTSSTPPTPCRS